MIQTQIDFEELEQKTSAEFANAVRERIAFLETDEFFKNEETRIIYQDVSNGLKIKIAFPGSIEVFEYRFITGRIHQDKIGWCDIRDFFDIPFKMKEIHDGEVTA